MVQPQIDWKLHLDALDDQCTRAILAWAITESALARDMAYRHGGAALQAEDARRRYEEQRNIDFSSHARGVWNILSREYRGSQVNAMYDAKCEVEEKITKIHDLARGRRSIGTKISALETLVEIGECITQATEIIGQEVRRDFQCNTCLEDAMIEILCEMVPDIQRQVAEMRYDDGDRFLDRVASLREESAGYCMMQGLKNVVKILEGAIGEASSEDDENPDESEDESGSGPDEHEQAPQAQPPGKRSH